MLACSLDVAWQLEWKAPSSLSPGVPHVEKLAPTTGGLQVVQSTALVLGCSGQGSSFHSPGVLQVWTYVLSSVFT